MKILSEQGVASLPSANDRANAKKADARLRQIPTATGRAWSAKRKSTLTPVWKTLPDAVKDFQNTSQVSTTTGEAQLALNKVQQLMQQQSVRNAGQACVVIESGSGGQACR